MSLESISQAVAELELKKKRLEAEIAAVQHEMGLWRLLRAIWYGEGCWFPFKTDPGFSSNFDPGYRYRV